MANKGNSKLIKLNTYAQIVSAARFLRFAFFFYAFLSFIFWFLSCFEVDWLYIFNWLFIIPYQIVGTFYTPDGLNADYSLVIIGAIFLFLGFIFDAFINNLYEKLLIMTEEEERRIQQQKAREQNRRRQQQMRRAQQQNKPATIEGLAQIGTPSVINNSASAMPTIQEPVPTENQKLLFIIIPHINKIKRTQNELELTFQEVEVWKQRIIKKLIENIIYSKPIQKGYYRKNLFLVYRDFNYVDEFLYYIQPTLEAITLEFRKYRIFISYSYVLSSLSFSRDLEKELDIMDTILSLNFINECIVTQKFKIAYDNRGVRKYKLDLKGEYNLSKNLSISNRQMLYRLINTQEKEKANENENNQNGTQ